MGECIVPTYVLGWTNAFVYKCIPEKIKVRVHVVQYSHLYWHKAAAYYDQLPTGCGRCMLVMYIMHNQQP